MKIDRARLSADPLGAVGKIVDALSNGLTPADNWQAKLLGPIITPGANVEFTVQHNLGTKPTRYIVNLNQNAVVYDSRRDQWTDQRMFLKCGGPGATLYLIVF